MIRIKINWISVTTLVSHFKKPFDAEQIAAKVTKNKRSKWFGIEPIDIEAIWNAESERAMTCLVPFITTKENLTYVL
jgi:hypothetical protein